MPIAPIKRTSAVRVIYRNEAEIIDCAAFYETSCKGVGTQDVTIYFQPGTVYGTSFQPGRPAVVVPRVSRKLSSLLPLNFDCAGIQIVYTYGRTGLDPEEKLTRAEFVMQTLGIWDRLYDAMRTIDTPGRTPKADLLAAMETLKSTYSIQELLPTGISMEEFKAYFGTQKENSDGTSN